METSFNFRYVPLAWYNNGYGCGYSHPELRSCLHLPLDIPKIATPPPPYTESQHKIVPMSDMKDTEKHVIYATVRPSLSKLNTVDPSPPASPRSISFESSHSETYYPASPTSDTGSSSSWFSTDSSHFANHKLRRSRRRARGLSLRELRLKESEADLKKVYSSTVDSYLSGEIFDNFRSWPEPVVEEDS